MTHFFDMDSKITAQLQTANNKLSKVKIRNKGNKLYIRGTLPPKPGDGILPRQYELSTGLAFTAEGVKIALARSQEIESRLNLEKFDWADYIENGEFGIKTISKWLEEFENHYWNVNQKTDNRGKGYDNHYKIFFNKLPQEESLSESTVIKILTQYQADSCLRAKAYIAYNALLNFAKIKHDLKQYKTNYQSNLQREIPTDEEIIQIVEATPEPWRWTMAMLATYGLRGHEFKNLDCSKIGVSPYIVYVDQDTKTGKRAVYPVPPQWVTRWQLWNINPPKIDTALINYYYGKRISDSIRNIMRRKIGKIISAYHLRDAYAIRCSVLNVDAAIASKWMGHSLDVHWRSYLKFFNEAQYKQAWEKMLENNEEI